MGITGRRQAEVAEILRRIPRLLHRRQHQERDGLFLRSPFDLVDQTLEVPRLQGGGRRSQRVAEAADELLELLHLAGVGFLVDPVKARAAVLLEVIRDRLVGQEHELFDDAMRDVALARDDVLDLA